LKHFGQFKIAKIDEKEVDSQEFIVEQLNDLKRSLEGLSAPFAPSRRPVSYPAGNEIDICCSGMDNMKIETFKAEMDQDNRIKSVRVVVLNNHVHLYAQCDIDSVAERREMEIKYREISRNLKRRKRASNTIESHH
jgi:hypothetical protein